MANRLIHATSPYLLQHADNPVDWHPWGDEAFALARAQDRPVLLSVGYSACHWCHVMAHESFEDPEVAAVMNRLFVNVKVDREERPDVDRIYQSAHHLLSQRSGGWPLTMFLTPDGKPFFGGTYFPRHPRHGLPGFVDLLERVATAYREQRAEIDAQNAELLSLLARTLPSPAPDGYALDRAPVHAACEALMGMFDPVHGGFGQAPKFPHPFDLDLLLREAVRGGDAAMRDAVLLTITKMAEGGIYDHLGGGFCRYSVDGHWTIPHFEKMLYDNGPLLRLYADAWVLTGDSAFLRTCEETAAWVMREMQSPEGGYYSSLDADSEGEEGRFYVWDRDQVGAALTGDEYASFAPRYGLDRAANFEGRHWHLHVARTLEQVAAMAGVPVEACAQRIASARHTLFSLREKRVRPGRDEKILTSWNALMIEGMARAARACNRPEWAASARRAASHLRHQLWRDGRLLATCKDGRSHLNAYLDDHAFLLGALLELMQWEFRADDLAWAREIADVLLAWFEDKEAGGFWFTSVDHEALILRPKPGHDDATPSGNGVAALHLQRLGHLTGERRYLAAAERTLRVFAPAMTRQAAGFASLCRALAEHVAPPEIVVLRGDPVEFPRWMSALRKHYRPASLVVAVPAGVRDLPEALDKPAGAGVNAWVCRGVECLPPIEEPDGVLAALHPAG
jgi:uncharacterized protein YyaL (SSP411 family)